MAESRKRKKIMHLSLFIPLFFVNACSPKGDGEECAAAIDVNAFISENNLDSAMEGISASAPPLSRGINYFTPALGPWTKGKCETRDEFKIIHQVLGADVIRIWGYDESVFDLVDWAREEGCRR